MNNLLIPLQTWWRSITPREQRLVGAGGGLALLGLLYWGLIAPLQSAVATAQQQKINEQQTLAWVEQKADEIVKLRASSGMAVSAQPLNQVVASTAGRYRIELVRVQPRDEMLQVWVQPAPFSQLIDWLAFLQETQGVSVEFLDIDRDAQSGVVKVARLQFKRG
ncbi:type II secretion system protein M [Vibrio sp. SM6]|uniref:Type II secretion system protein M n=1 Tax=Vibrio agarilyticus TaxID=2726741 RepID=A0A7X8TTZ8_9VIBR|nr:type II secretion system protein M [Vibrio agarilyticus]NLS14477.1 type II secretion system protein M [Vibrio agarilyticus]